MKLGVGKNAVKIFLKKVELNPKGKVLNEVLEELDAPGQSQPEEIPTEPKSTDSSKIAKFDDRPSRTPFVCVICGKGFAEKLVA